jgi:hypothetical protein
MVDGTVHATAQGGRAGCGTEEAPMTTRHWTAALVVAAMLVSCKPAGDSADRTSGDAGTTGAATPMDTTMTGGQGGMADTAMSGTADTTRTGGDTSRP